MINITKLQYPSPVSQYPSLNKLKGIKTNKTIPTLKKDHQIYEKEDEKPIYLLRFSRKPSQTGMDC